MHKQLPQAAGTIPAYTGYLRDRNEHGAQAKTANSIEHLRSKADECGAECIYLYSDDAWSFASAAEADELRGFFLPLAQHVNRHLDRCGMPPARWRH